MVKGGLELGYADLKNADNAVFEQEKDFIRLEQELDQDREGRGSCLKKGGWNFGFFPTRPMRTGGAFSEKVPDHVYKNSW